MMMEQKVESLEEEMRKEVMQCNQRLDCLMKDEIPECRHNLDESHTNLLKVADYCEENYNHSGNKRAALEETVNYTTQSLASVAYQINTLACNFLQMLDSQTTQLASMESEVNFIRHMVMIHKEKIARREIGVLTTSKGNTRQYKIIAPSTQERPIKYVRKPIDYSILDDIGHGVKMTNSTTPRQKRGTSASASIPLSAGPAPTTKPPTPPQTGRVAKSSKEYRTPPAVAPPQVPSNYAANYPLGHARRGERIGGYSTLPAQHSTHTLPHTTASIPHSVANMPHTTHPQVGMVHPIQQGTLPHQHSQGILHAPPQAPPPHHPVEMNYHHGQHPMHQPHIQHPPPAVDPNATMPRYSRQMLGPRTSLPMKANFGRGVWGFAPPSPLPPTTVDMERSGNISPPLPPPPPEQEHVNHTNQNQLIYHGFPGIPGMQHGIPPQHVFPSQANHPGQGPAFQLGHHRPGSDGPPRVIPQEHNLPGWVPKNYLEKVIAIYDYHADKDDELSFEENAVIYVLKKNDDGWWEGVMEGLTGLFPSNYVEPCI